MDARRFQNLTPQQLAQLLDLGRIPDWSAGESAEILRHQLAAPLLPDLGRVPGAEGSRLEALVRGRRGAESFERQLTFISPSVEILTAIKHFARHFREVSGDPLRGMPATVLYYGAIAAALIRCHTRITQLTDSQLREAFAWAKVQPGAEALQGVFFMALERISVE